MKKLFKKLFGAITVGALSLAALVPSTAVQKASAAQVQADASRIIQWAESTKWVNEGLEIYAGQWAGGGFRMFFDVSEGKEVELKFKVPVYEENSTNFITENGNTYSKYILDIIVESFTNTGKAVLRLWGDSGSAVGSTNISAKVTSGDLHAESASSKPNEVAEGLWVKGVMRESSEFYVAFNTTDFFKTYWGTWDTTSSLLGTGQSTGASATAGNVMQTLNNTFNPAGNPCESVQVYFRLSANCQNNNCGESTCPSCGSTMKSKLILTEVNGQSLANTNGVVNDTTAPYIAPVEVKNNATLTLGKAYNVEVKTSPRESATSELFCAFDSDIFSYEKLTYSAKVVAPSGAEEEYSLSNVKFVEAGANKISVTVTDEAGNTYTTPETTVNIAQGFLMTVDNVPETGYLNQVVTLPAGTATDSQNNPCTVNIKVSDPYTRTVELDGTSFTPTMKGVYTVEYSSQNADGSEFDKQTFRLVITDAPVGGSSSNSGSQGGSQGGGSSSKGCLSSVEGTASVLMCVACGAAAAFVMHKRKEN